MINITGGKYNSLKIQTADFNNIKPTLSKIRQAVFNSIFSLNENYQTFCDLFAGSGIMTFEAISRGYDVTSVEIDKKTVNVIKKNASALKIPIKILNYDALKFIKTTDKTFDIFYIDPPYYSELYDKVLFNIKTKNLLNNNGIIILEKPIDVKVNFNNFSCIKSKKYSDKEILFLKILTKFLL